MRMVIAMKKILIACILSALSLFGSLQAAESLNKNDTILVVGASGRTGSLIVSQLSIRGYKVVAMARDVEKARAVLGDQMNIVWGDLTQFDSLLLATKGVAGIINAAGASGKGSPETVDYQGTKNLVAAAKKNGVKKIVLLSSLGVTDKDHFLNRVANNILIWKLKGENELRDSGLEYSIIRPGGLSDADGAQKAIEFGQGDKISGQIPRADVARVCVDALLLSEANAKTTEIISTEGPVQTSLAAIFDKLLKD